MFIHETYGDRSITIYGVSSNINDEKSAKAVAHVFLLAGNLTRYDKNILLRCGCIELKCYEFSERSGRMKLVDDRLL